MADEILCPRCRAASPSGTGFCGACGSSLDGGTTAEGGPDPLIGAFVGGRFLVLRKLGEGGMGAVYEAEQTAVGRKVALKFLHPHLTKDADLLARFRNEAAAASRLDHPNTITVYDFGETETGSPYLAMEFIEGVSLDGEIRRSGPLAWRRAARIAAQISDSLANAHESGIVHRDLKPENVMLLARGPQRDIVKVVDFGIAKILEADGEDRRQALTRTGMVIGTPRYMSPEQIRGERVDARSDVYSAGVIVYEMLTGVPPFDSESPMGLLTRHLMDPPPPFARAAPAVQVPPELERLVLRMLAKSAGDRPQTMREVAGEIEALLAPAPAVAAAPRRRTGIGTIAGIAAGALLLAGGAGAAAWYFATGPVGPSPGVFGPVVAPPPIPVPPVPVPPVPGQPPAGAGPAPGSLPAVPDDPPAGAGPPAGGKSPAGKPKGCSFDAGEDDIGQAVRDALRGREAQIRACARGLSGSATAKFSFSVAANARQVSGVAAQSATGLEACLRPSVAVSIGESDRQARTGDVTISLRGNLGAESCSVRVVARKKGPAPKPWNPLDGGVAEGEIGSLVQDKLDQFKKQLEKWKKAAKDTDSGD